MIWLLNCNVCFIKLCWDLKNKQLKIFYIIECIKTIYKLNWSAIIWVHNVFHLKLLYLCVNDSLFSQYTSSLIFIITENNKKNWEINDILNLKHYYERLQYKIKWHSINQNNKWYYTDTKEFNESVNVLTEFHYKYLN